MKLTPEKLTAFCAALAETCQVSKACAAVGIARWTAYQWRRDLPDFAEAWDEAMKAGLLALEDEAHRRGFEGVEEPLTHQGQFTPLYEDVLDGEGQLVRDADGIPKRRPVLDENGRQRYASIRKYSDTLAIFLLKAHAPEKYRENSRVELAGQLALSTMTEDDMRAELAALVASGVVPVGLADDGADLV